MKIGFLFSGQGSQAVGMGKAFYDAMPAVRELFDAAETALSMPIKKFLFEGPEETLTRTDITQPAIALVSLAALRVARDRGIEAHAACGHSLGEYAALVSAGVMEELDALRVVARRGQAMQAAADAAPGIMAAVVGLSLDQVQAALEGIAGVQVAAQNAPDQIVLSGETAAVEAAVEKMKSAGAKNAVPLKTSGAWHSHLMEPATGPLEAALSSVRLRSPSFPVVANATAEPFPFEDEASARDLLARQLTSPIRFVDCLLTMRALGVDAFVELGPGKVLRGLVKKLDRTIPAFNVEDPASLDETIKAVSAGRPA
ncbi:MAG: [acyl-carrier-protein] S-malonyltransferase [Candidatus Lindowbacteria bacterium RIFCSPLOWO2_12_FULL_62_27]|nr:MAG: [acyl-carrier-protein] S-malonyltransferase [Candidatus Lindowbacteria bacterium RIFCSPLOWO2_12_FULL_62_27]OGH63794.1 MAG: [acyl-carrier-protein] S-malonyltransferase [Candidatus Lindowbacteria bacterium RIFCSPLOWO2_02_FULL_62_12]